MRQCLDVLRGGNGFRIVFERQQDRYAHSIEAVRGDRKQVLLRSYESDAQSAWPASPPLQQLTFERRPDGSMIALAIGMAGSSHWSLSVETDIEQLASELDVACRCVRQPEYLGSQYEVAGSGLADARVLDITSSLGQLRILPVAHGAAEPIGALEWDAEQRLLKITPADSQLLCAGRVWTVRWRYRVQWATLWGQRQNGPLPRTLAPHPSAAKRGPDRRGGKCNLLVTY